MCVFICGSEYLSRYIDFLFIFSILKLKERTMCRIGYYILTVKRKYKWMLLPH